MTVFRKEMLNWGGKIVKFAERRVRLTVSAARGFTLVELQD